MNTKIKKVAELLLLELINDNDTYFRLAMVTPKKTRKKRINNSLKRRVKNEN